MSNKRTTGWIIDATSMAVLGFSIAAGVLVGFLERPIFGVLVTLLCMMLGEIVKLEGLYRANESLIGEIEKFPGSRKFIEHLVDAATDIFHGQHGDALSSELQKVLDETAEQVEDLRKGHVIRPASNTWDLASQTDLCLKTLDAVTNLASASVTSGTTWWMTSPGVSYWESNVRAIARGVSIRRVFVIDDLTAEIRKILELHASEGIRVYYVLSRTLGPQKRINVALWDGRVAWRGYWNAEGQNIANHLVFNGSEVAKIKDIFEDVLLESSQFRPASAP